MALAGVAGLLRTKQLPGPVQLAMRDRRINALDWLGIAGAIVLAGLTIWAASYPIPGTDAWLFAAIGWSLVAIVWAVGVIATTRERVPRAAALILLVGAVASIPFFGFSLLLLMLGGVAAVGLGALTGLSLLAVVVGWSQVRRAAWLVAPAIVLATIVVLFSGIPRLTRMAFAEPALNAFVRTVDPGSSRANPTYFDDPVLVGSIPVYEAYVHGGGVHLVTGFVGMLGDDGAGIAYFENGTPVANALYDHVTGAWYRWYPY